MDWSKVSAKSHNYKYSLSYFQQAQLKRLATQQALAQQGTTVVAGQKVVAASGGQSVTMPAGLVQKAVAVTTPLLTTISGATVSQAARLQTVPAGTKIGKDPK